MVLAAGAVVLHVLALGNAARNQAAGPAAEEEACAREEPGEQARARRGGREHLGPAVGAGHLHGVGPPLGDVHHHSRRRHRRALGQPRGVVRGRTGGTTGGCPARREARWRGPTRRRGVARSGLEAVHGGLVRGWWVGIARWGPHFGWLSLHRQLVYEVVSRERESGEC